MSLLSLLSDRSLWEEYYEYKTSLCCPLKDAKELREFIDREEYLSVCEEITAEKPFPLPKKTVISKLSTGKKRIVYTYPPRENTVLKLLTWMLLRKYDHLFTDSLYSFRPKKTAKEAVERLLSTTGRKNMYVCKEDLSNYFNSIPVNKMTRILKEVLSEDPKLCRFLTDLLEEPCVLYGGEKITEEKGIMAGTPLSAFCANLYLMDLDRAFSEKGLTYARYSDDILFFAPALEDLQTATFFLKHFLAEKELTLNPEKEMIQAPGEPFVFLGFQIHRDQVDIAPASIRKMKGKMRRKTRSLLRWARKNDLPGEKAAIAFIKVFERKFYENEGDHDLTWSRWYFPVITTDAGLKELDHYAVDCIRVLVSGGKHTKIRFRTGYEEIRQLGFRSLVHEYYRSKKPGTVTDTDPGSPGSLFPSQPG